MNDARSCGPAGSGRAARSVHRGSGHADVHAAAGRSTRSRSSSIASFLLLLARARPFDPCAKLRTTQGRPGGRPLRDEPAPRRVGASPSTARGSATRCTATSGTSQQTHQPTSATRCRRRMWYTVQLIFWGILVSAFLVHRARRLLGGPAVLDRRLHVHRRSRSSGSRCRRSGSVCSRSSSSPSVRRTWFRPRPTDLLLRRSPQRRGQTGFNWTTPATSCCRC